jgi:hypothetical protein
MEEKMIDIRLVGTVYETEYILCQHSHYGNTPFCYTSSVTREHSHFEVWKGQIESPPLIIGDYIFVDDLNKTFQVTQVIRSTKGGYVYVVNQDKYIDNEESKEKAEQEKKEFTDFIDKQIRRYQLEIEAEEIKQNEKKWYQFWK